MEGTPGVLTDKNRLDLSDLMKLFKKIYQYPDIIKPIDKLIVNE